MGDRRTSAQRHHNENGFGDLRIQRAEFSTMFAWSLMQYGHCVVSASAISSLSLLGVAPSAKAVLSKAAHACIAS